MSAAAPAPPPMGFLPPPSPLPPNGWGGNDRGPTLNGVTWFMTILATSVVGLRMISRTALGGNKLGLDDYITLVCLVVIYITAITLSVAVAAGAGKHVWEVPLQDLPVAGSRIATVNVMSLWAFSLPKFAIVAVIERLVRLQTWTRCLLWGLAIINEIGIVVLTILFTTQCQSCGGLEAQEAIGWVFSVMSPVLDTFYAIYPIPYIMRLNMSKRRRIAVSCALGLGCLASAVSIYKVTLLPSVTVALAMDPTYGVLPIVLFGMVEANTLIITASLPTIGPLLRWLSGKTPYSRAGTGKSSHDASFHGRSQGYKLGGAEELGTIDSDRRPVLDSSIHKSVQISISRD